MAHRTGHTFEGKCDNRYCDLYKKLIRYRIGRDNVYFNDYEMTDDEIEHLHDAHLREWGHWNEEHWRKERNKRLKLEDDYEAATLEIKRLKEDNSRLLRLSDPESARPTKRSRPTLADIVAGHQMVAESSVAPASKPAGRSVWPLVTSNSTFTAKTTTNEDQPESSMKAVKQEPMETIKDPSKEQPAEPTKEPPAKLVIDPRNHVDGICDALIEDNIIIYKCTDPIRFGQKVCALHMQHPTTMG